MIPIILSAFAVYRVSRMLTLEEGPFMIFGYLQGWAEKQDSWVKRGLACALCTGFWLSLVPALLLPVADVPWYLAWLAIAGMQAVLHQVAG